MDNPNSFLEIIKLIIANGDSIVFAIGTLLSAIVGVLTLINQIMPSVITNSKLAKIEAITSRFSIGSKKAEIIKPAESKKGNS